MQQDYVKPIITQEQEKYFYSDLTFTANPQTLCLDDSEKFLSSIEKLRTSAKEQNDRQKEFVPNFLNLVGTDSFACLLEVSRGCAEEGMHLLNIFLMHSFLEYTCLNQFGTKGRSSANGSVHIDLFKPMTNVAVSFYSKPSAIMGDFNVMVEDVDQRVYFSHEKFPLGFAELTTGKGAAIRFYPYFNRDGVFSALKINGRYSGNMLYSQFEPIIGVDGGIMMLHPDVLNPWCPGMAAYFHSFTVELAMIDEAYKDENKLDYAMH